VVLFGVYVLADGLALLYGAVRGGGGDERWLFGLQGVVGIITAAVAFVYPQNVVVAAVYLFGAWAILTGLLEVVVALRLTASVRPAGGLLGVCGVLSIALGVLLFRSPGASALIVARLFGAYQLAGGAVLLTLAERLRRPPERAPTGGAGGAAPPL